MKGTFLCLGLLVLSLGWTQALRLDGAGDSTQTDAEDKELVRSQRDSPQDEEDREAALAKDEPSATGLQRVLGLVKPVAKRSSEAVLTGKAAAFVVLALNN